jgi:DNA-binding MarR family transcriptional regulator
MISVITRPGTDREQRIDYVSDHLLLHAGVLTRLLIRDSRSELTRTEAGLLFTLGRGPRRITELAELEGLAQPTVTLLVKKLEGRGWVKRDHLPDDGRVVLLSLTGGGAAALTEFRAQVSAALRVDMQAMSDEQIAALETTTDALGALVDLQQAP